MHWLESATVAIAAVVLALDRFGLLPRRRSSVDAAGELAIASRTIERLRSERNHARQLVDELKAKTSLEPVLKQLAENSRLQSEVLDRLIHHNGSFKHMEESLGEIHEGLKLLTGFIAGIADISLRERP